jgi:hypothetical protein
MSAPSKRCRARFGEPGPPRIELKQSVVSDYMRENRGFLNGDTDSFARAGLHRARRRGLSSGHLRGTFDLTVPSRGFW